MKTNTIIILLLLLGIFFFVNSCDLIDSNKAIAINPLVLPPPDTTAQDLTKVTIRFTNDSVLVEDQLIAMPDLENHLQELKQLSEFHIELNPGKDAEMEKIVKVLDIGMHNNYNIVLVTEEE